MSLFPDVSPPSPDRMPALVVRCEADHGALRRRYSAPYSPVRRDRLRRFLCDWQQVLEQMEFDALTAADRADWLLLRGHLAAEGRELDQEEQGWDAAAPLLPFAASLIALEDRRLALEDVQPEAAAETLDRAAVQVRALRAALPEDADRNSAGRILAQMLPLLERWYGFYDGYDPLFTWWVDRPYQALTAALSDYAACLQQTETALVSPIGREALWEALQAAQIAYTPEELMAAGDAELRWCRTELIRAAQEMGQGNDWRAALETVKRGHEAPGRQPALVRDLTREAIEYVEREDLLTVPALAQETGRMAMMSPERQKVNPFFLGGEQIVVSFPTRGMEHPQKQTSLRGNNRAFARATVQHELIPGHHLQSFYQERFRPYRQLFYTPFWTEGWTLHWEMLLWERGFARC